MSEARYWNGVAQEWRGTERDRLWRACSDAIHLKLLERWGILPTTGLVLKTDLFDEAASGSLGRALSSPTSLLLGMDLSSRTVQAAALRLPQAALFTADVRALPVKSDSVDTIISNSTLDHLASRTQIEGALAELARILTVDGALLVTLDNPQHPVLWLRQRLPWALLHRLGLAPYQMGPTLSLERLVEACTQAGLTVTRRGAVMHCPRVLAVQVGRLLHRWGAQAGAAYVRFFACWEWLGRWPTRLATGRFVAVLAHKPPALRPEEI